MVAFPGVATGLSAKLVTFVTFHVVTFACLTIAFWPHLMCLLAFLPLERLRTQLRGTSTQGLKNPAALLEIIPSEHVGHAH